MTFALLTLTLLVLLGIPAALCLDPHLPGPARLGLGFLLGAGIMPLLLLTLSLLGIPWSVPGVAVSGTLLTALLLFVSSSFAVAGCLLGFAALTKNEGLALLVSVAMALFLDSALARRSLFRLWPAAVIVAFWWIPRTFHGLSSELVAGSLLHRVSAHLKDPIVFWKALASHWWQPFLWFCIAATLFFCRREIARRDRFLITAVVIQMAFYLFSYAASPYDLGWHISTSWPRLLSHLLLPLLFLALTCLVRALSGEKLLAEPRWIRISEA